MCLTIIFFFISISSGQYRRFKLGCKSRTVGNLVQRLQRKELKLYVAFKKIKNFAAIVVQKNKFLIYLNISPDLVLPLPSFARDVRLVGHWATGDLELSITSAAEFDMAKSLIHMAY